MISKSIIHSNTTSTTYTRGMELYTNNKIKECAVTEGAEYDTIKAIVKGSGRNSYSVSLTYDIISDEIDDTYCECPAFYSYEGVCKHCVAVLLEYMAYKQKQQRLLNNTSRQQVALEELKTMKGVKQQKPRQPKPVQTTPIIKQLLSSYTMKRTLPLLQDSQYGKVCLEAFLNCNDDSIELEFKLGVTHMYVLKDVFAFENALEKCETLAYGQKLKFSHTMEAFSPECRPMVQFVRNWVHRNKARYAQNLYYGYGYNYGYSSMKLRQIPLSTDDLDEFLEVLVNKKVLANINYTGEKQWYLTEEELPREMHIQGNTEGIEVKINYLFGFKSSHANIYFNNNKIYKVEAEKVAPIMDFLNCMTELPNRTFHLHKDDVPAFCRELLPTLEQHFTCRKENFDEKDYGLLPVSFEVYLDAPQKDYVTCKVLAIYGDNKFNIYNTAQKSTTRDQVREVEVGKIVGAFFNAYDDQKNLMVLEEDEDKLYELLAYGIPKLQEFSEVYVSDALKRLKIITAPKVSVGVSVTEDLMELKMTAEDMSKEQLLEILTKYNRKKKFYRLKNGDFVNISGEKIEALLEIKQGLQLTESQLKQNAIEIPKYRALYLDAELKEKMSLPVVKDKGFKALIRNMKTAEDNDFDIPADLEKVLREYQKRGYLWIKTLKYNHFGGILADDMGLGKTLQVICFLLSEYQEAALEDNRKALIVCPASLVFNWSNEISKFAPQLPVKMVIGSLAQRKEMLEGAGNKDILVTSYDLLKRDIEFYENMKFYCEIIDEAQFIKNSNTQAAKAVKIVKAGFKLALTGTPIENRLSELWSIFDYLMPGFLYTYQRFREEFELPIVQNQEEAAVKRLQKMITPFVLRRLKKEVLTDLPDKLEENLYVSIEGEQQKLYDAHVKKLQLMLDKQSDDEFKNSKIQLLAELTKLRQLCCDPALLYEEYKDSSAKMEVCMDLIQNAISSGHKLLLFSQFTSMLERIQQQLSKNNILYYSLSGATSKEKRAKMVDDFNKDDVPVFCISLKAGGTGLNLTAADIVIHFDPWWNLAVQNQATDRAHRIGQKNVVNVYKLIVKGTIEENIMKMQDKKKELAEQVLSGEGMNVGSFSKEDLLELLK